MSNGEFNASDCGAGNEAAGGSKLAYQRPSLTVFGSVRELTGGGSMGNGDGQLPGKAAPKTSDPAAKENAVRIGTHPAGFGIYLFDYKAELRDAHGHGRQFGVMANEVEMVLPEAVMVGADGYRAVNYSMLGITHH